MRKERLHIPISSEEIRAGEHLPFAVLLRKRIQEIVEQEGCQEHEIAIRAKAGASALSSWKAGKYCPSRQKLLTIATGLKIPIDELIQARKEQLQPEHKRARKEALSVRGIKSPLEVGDVIHIDHLERAITILRALKTETIGFGKFLSMLYVLIKEPKDEVLFLDFREIARQETCQDEISINQT
jgi:transcriptional regulator with XRE-family HTH domain